MDPRPFAPLEAERIVLRRFRPEDAPVFSRYRSDPDVSRFQLRSFDCDEARYFAANQAVQQPGRPGSWFQLAVECKSTGALIGDCGLRFPEDQTEQVEIGITIAPEHHGRGFGAEAVNLALEWVFEDLGKHRAWASTDPMNMKAIGLLERLGFRKEAHHLKSLRLHGEWADDVIYAMLAEEWARRRQTAQ